MKWETYEQIIDRVTSSSAFHGKFVNTLSMLEYMGARKILKSQRAETMTLTLLAHTAEEIRHAQMLKKLALKLSDGQLKGYSEKDLLCGAGARKYFQAIDYAGASVVQETGSNYLLTTLLIEERATQIYPIYEKALEKLGIPNPMRGLIREEDAHLSEIRQKLQEDLSISDHDLLRLRNIETEQFNLFMDSVFDAVQSTNSE